MHVEPGGQRQHILKYAYPLAVALFTDTVGGSGCQCWRAGGRVYYFHSFYAQKSSGFSCQAVEKQKAINKKTMVDNHDQKRVARMERRKH